MYFTKISLLTCMLIASSDGFKSKCLSVPTLPAKVESFMKTCQSEIKSNIIDDLVYTSLNDNPYSSGEFADLLKPPHVGGYQQQNAKYKFKQQHHHGFADQIKKPLTLSSQHDFEYFDPDHSQLWQKFAAFQAANGIASATSHYKEPHGLQSIEHSSSTFPEYIIDGNYHRITPSTSIKFATPPTEVEERNEKVENDKKDKVVEAREELLKILANHKIVARQTNGKNPRNNSIKNTKSNSTIASESRRDKRGIFDYFNRNKNEDLAAHNHHHYQHHLDHLPAAAAGGVDLHPSLNSEADRWLAGCMMQCIFRKTHALDKHGYPSLDGIVDLYTEGIHDQYYFMYTLRAVNKCLKIVSKKHSVKRSIVPLKSETCDIAFDVFDCVSDAITAYCH